MNTFWRVLVWTALIVMVPLIAAELGALFKVGNWMR